jgi:DNA ligase (NAD+)
MNDRDPKLWKTPKLVSFLQKASLAYRQGSPIIDDHTYDHLYLAELQQRDPLHPFLNKIEIEPDFGSDRLKHPEPMLSIEKSYSVDETKKWITRILKEVNKQAIDEVDISVIATAKLDGLAAFYREDNLLATRGDGIHGNDITSCFGKGVVNVGKKVPGVGELVMTTDYFETNLKKLGYAHPRNICVGVVNSDEVNEDFIKALKDGVVRFVPYSTLDRWEGSFDELIDNHDAIQKQVLKSCEYPTDGVVVEITHTLLKTILGSTSHHNRWQIAIKQRSATKETTVNSITWQTKRTGRVTPVLEVEPIELSGATVRRVTAHHAGNVRALRLGKGAIITVERSGEVIPKIVNVVKPATTIQIVKTCLSCGHDLTWQRDFLVCINHSDCPSQRKNTLEHFFKIHGQVDGFGSKSIEKLVADGIDTLEKIYNSNEEDFLQAGFGPVQSKNLRRELERSLQVEIEDWRFLGAFGISQLGLGDSRRLLQHMRINNLDKVTKDEIMEIEGFAEISSADIVNGLVKKWSIIKHMLGLGFNLSQTPLLAESKAFESPVSGMKLVFTGKMVQGSRDQMKKNALELGAELQSSVSAKTDLLICGEKVGPTKIAKAQKLGIRIMSEEEYFILLQRQ